MTLIIQIAKFKLHQYQMRAVSAKAILYTFSRILWINNIEFLKEPTDFFVKNSYVHVVFCYIYSP